MTSAAATTTTTTNAWTVWTAATNLDKNNNKEEQQENISNPSNGSASNDGDHAPEQSPTELSLTAMPPKDNEMVSPWRFPFTAAVP